MSSTENIPKGRSAMPAMSGVPTYKSGPTMQRLRTRTIVIYALMCIAGALPYALTQAGVTHFSAGLQAAALGLWFPGAGLIAVGTVWCILLGLLFFWVFLKFGSVIWGMPAVVLMLAYLWVLSIVGGTFVRHSETPWYSALIVAVFAAYMIISRTHAANKTHRRFMELRKVHVAYLEEEEASLRERTAEPQPAERRELSEDAVKASRYLFDLTLRKPGDFSGYDSLEQILTSALRYILDYIGYSLAIMQCMYTPNFHGYLNRAQQFIIEGFTRPEVCGYWKWEYLSTFHWDPDPIKNMNIMFSGWSGLVITLYGANTGDRRYEQPGALKFKPFTHRNKTYDYSAGDIVKVISKNWKKYPTTLFPCEPHLTFPQCNAFAMDAVLAYDRQHGTSFLAENFPALEKRYLEDFFLPSGDFVFVNNTLLGLRSLAACPARFDGTNAFITARILNAVMPGIAKRTYLFGLKDMVGDSDGDFTFDNTKPDRMLDDGNFKVGPAYLIGIVAAAAAEFGDEETVRRMLAYADRHMQRLDDPKVLAYKKASVIGNAHIASARFAQKDDLYHTIHTGPGEGAFTGPILESCAYPDVLVARAMSSGDDLDLVLYNGRDAGMQSLRIERLKPDRTYKIEETGFVFKSDTKGCAVVEVSLDGRTPVHIVPA